MPKLISAQYQEEVLRTQTVLRLQIPSQYISLNQRTLPYGTHQNIFHSPINLAQTPPAIHRHRLHHRTSRHLRRLHQPRSQKPLSPKPFPRTHHRLHSLMQHRLRPPHRLAHPRRQLRPPLLRRSLLRPRRHPRLPRPRHPRRTQTIYVISDTIWICEKPKAPQYHSAFFHLTLMNNYISKLRRCIIIQRPEQIILNHESLHVHHHPNQKVHYRFQTPVQISQNQKNLRDHHDQNLE